MRHLFEQKDECVPKCLVIAFVQWTCQKYSNGNKIKKIAFKQKMILNLTQKFQNSVLCSTSKLQTFFLLSLLVCFSNIYSRHFVLETDTELIAGNKIKPTLQTLVLFSCLFLQTDVGSFLIIRPKLAFGWRWVCNLCRKRGGWRGEWRRAFE